MEHADAELNQWGLLPHDIDASMLQIRERFGATPRRAVLLDALEYKLLPSLVALGFDGPLWLDGSFVTIKPEPRDLDVIVDATECDDDVFLPLARLVIASHAAWHADLELDVHLRHPRMPKDVLRLFHYVRDEYRAAYNVPAGVTKGLVTWTP